MPLALRALRCPRGFTLMELIAVIAVVGIMFAVVGPRLESALSPGGPDLVVRTIAGYVIGQKEKAVVDHEEKFLFVDFSTGRIGKAEKRFPDKQGPDTDHPAFTLPKDVRLVDIQWPGVGTQVTGLAQIRVSPEGYVQYAAIHLADEDGKETTLILEPFLAQVQVRDGYVSLEKR
ncbi:MAG: prepilin-type N-terminal cleavage/methylation domain-containing protein [Pseudomonadota bacterium]